MSESIWDAFGVTPEQVSENPFSIVPKGRRACAITDAKVGTFKDSDIPQFMIEFTVTEGPDSGKKANVNHRMKPWTPQEKENYEFLNTMALTNYKKDLVSFGLNTPEIQRAFDPRNPDHCAKIIGLSGSAIFGPQEKRPEYNMVSDFELAGSNQVADTSGNGAPSASVTPTASKAETVDLASLNWGTGS